MAGRRTSNPSTTTRWRQSKRRDAALSATVLGVPQMPVAVGEDNDAAQLWPLLIGQLQQAGILSELDGPALEACCRCWSLYRRAISICCDDPTDRNSAGNLVKFQKAFESWVTRLGLTPTDRSRGLGVVDAAVSDFDRFLASRPT